jgi:hypothetical protein
MDKHAFDLWLKEAGLQLMTTPPAPAEAEMASDDAAELPSLSPVAELDLADPEDDDEGDGVFADFGRPGDRLENAELVAAAFRAAGNPKYLDVRLKTARGGNCPLPTYREIAVQRAKRVSASVEW